MAWHGALVVRAQLEHNSHADPPLPRTGTGCTCAWRREANYVLVAPVQPCASCINTPELQAADHSGQSLCEHNSSTTLTPTLHCCVQVRAVPLHGGGKPNVCPQFLCRLRSTRRQCRGTERQTTVPLVVETSSACAHGAPSQRDSIRQQNPPPCTSTGPNLGIRTTRMCDRAGRASPSDHAASTLMSLPA